MRSCGSVKNYPIWPCDLLINKKQPIRLDEGTFKAKIVQRYTRRHRPRDNVEAPVYAAAGACLGCIRVLRRLLMCKSITPGHVCCTVTEAATLTTLKVPCCSRSTTPTALFNASKRGLVGGSCEFALMITCSMLPLLLRSNRFSRAICLELVLVRVLFFFVGYFVV